MALQRHQPAPLDPVRSMLRIAAYRGGNPVASQHPPAARARHQGTALDAVTTAAPCSGHPFPAGSPCPGAWDADRWMWPVNPLNFSICERAKTKRPRQGSEGVRVSSEDRGRRSSVGEDQQMAGSSTLRSPQCRRYAGASRPCPRRAGRRRIEFAMWKECVMEVLVAIRRACDEGRRSKQRKRFFRDAAIRRRTVTHTSCTCSHQRSFGNACFVFA